MLLESSQQGLQLRFKPHPDRRSTQEVIILQSRESSNLGDFETPKTKSHLDEGATERCKIYYMGEGDGFPRIRAMMSLVSSRSPVVRPNTKGVSTMH
jgi:hypothetical protein